jgi:MoxR-like ATPase
MQIIVQQPSYNEEVEIARRMGVSAPKATQVLTTEQLLALQGVTDSVFVHHAVLDYAVRIVMTTRDPATGGLPQLAPQLALGASPRATLGMIAAGRALAVLRGRTFLTPQDVFDVAPEILRHRLMLSYDALADGVTTDDVVRQVLSTVPAPTVTPRQDDANPTQTPAAGPNWLQAAG